jgi:hypothetical protein
MVWSDRGVSCLHCPLVRRLIAALMRNVAVPVTAVCQWGSAAVGIGVLTVVRRQRRLTVGGTDTGAGV